jgi:Lipase maturation factor
MASRLEQEQNLRHRGGKGPRADPDESFLKLEKDVDATVPSCSNDKKAQAHPAAPSRGNQHANEGCSSFVVAKWAILRLLAVVYFFAFLGAHYQNDGLMGRNGLEPASLDAAFSRYSTPTQRFLHHPTIFWFVPLTDANLSRLYLGGVVLSCAAAAGINSWLIQFGLWLAYFSIVTVAQLSPAASFYSYGWESQLLETGLLAIFLCQLPSLSIRGGPTVDWALYERRRNGDNSSALPVPRPSPVVRWLFGWLVFRISIGAGLIKVRGSSCWKDKTCLHYHFETQPIPSPLSFAFHFVPRRIQSQMVDVDLWVQLYTSFLVLIPAEFVPSRWKRPATVLLRVGGVLQVGFMVGILLSGNFAFLNHLTIIPGVACFDDGFVPRFLLNRVAKKQTSSLHPGDGVDSASSTLTSHRRRWLRPSRTWVDVALLMLVMVLSWPVVANLLQLQGSKQVMNASFDPFRIVNTYGAFGSVGTSRYEAIIQVHNGTRWIEIELPCKPGDVRRRPCWCAPYHYRLDWNIWFLGFKPHPAMLRQREAWMFSLLVKLLRGEATPRPWLDLLDSTSSDLLRTQYYDRGSAPLMAKVDMYHYRMKKSLSALVRDYWNGKDLVWWKRRFEESLIPPVMLDESGTRLQLVPTDRR